jgi:NarL family two-component system response regulator LiaR
MKSSGKIRVILIDDHRRVHEAVFTVLNSVEDIALIAQGSNGKEALQLCEEHQPDLILMDVVMPVMSGLEATKLIHQRYPHIKILVLSSFQDDESVRAMLQHGAVGYILKGSLIDDLVNTIRITHSGKAVFSSEIASTLLNSAQPKVQDFGLTGRELEILQLMTEGLNNGEIAAKLVISPSTVKFHIANILHKMNVETRAEAIVLAAKNNLV